MKSQWLVLLMMCLSLGFAQNTVSGTVTELSTGEALVGANVYIKGSSVGATTDQDGFYTFEIENGRYTLVGSYVGYTTFNKAITVLGDVTTDFTMSLEMLGSEVEVTANRAKSRETPIAFTNVGKDEIDANYVTQDVPDLIKNVPGVFVSSGGLGEGEIFIRGFDAEHIQIMINGIPVNDPESQRTYWSNWSGLSSSASSIQVQRGVGSSLYGSGSFGGSVNISHGLFNQEETYQVSMGAMDYDGDTDRTARNGVFGVSYTTGLVMDKKWNFSLQYERKVGDSFSKGTNYDGHSFSLGAQFTPNEAHVITANFVGAPQKHNQSRAAASIDWLKKFGHEFNRNQNPYQENYYFKPQYELHHEWMINDKMAMKTNAFFTTGAGGGTYLRNDFFDVETGINGFKSVSNNRDVSDFGASAIYRHINSGIAVDDIIDGATITKSDFTYQDPDGNDVTVDDNYTITFDNNGTEETVSRYYQRSRGRLGDNASDLISGKFNHSWRNDSHSEHEQFGFNTYFDYKINDQYTVYAGGEFRHWLGLHFADSELFRKSDGMGGITTLNNVQQRYNYDGIVDNVSFFARVLFKPMENLTLMVDGQQANYSYEVEEKAIDVYDFVNEKFTGAKFFATKNIENSDGSKKFKSSDYKRDYSFFTPKFGLNYNVNRNLNFFGNYSIAKKEPKVGDWYSRSSGPADNDIKEETIKTTEFGVGYITESLSVQANYYMSSFEDKIESVTLQNQDRETINAGNADHSGLELAANYNLNSNFSFGTSMTFADNKWKDLSVDEIFGIDAKEVEGKVVPFSPQQIMNFNAAYRTKIADGDFHVKLGYMSWADYYANYENNVKLPDYMSIDLSFGYSFLLSGITFDSGLHINNITNEVNYSRASWGSDFGRSDFDFDSQMYVQAAPLRNIGMTLKASF